MSHAHAGRFPYEKHAKLDDAERQERMPVEPGLDALELEPNHVVLDLGAGTGYFAVPIARRLETGKVVAVDVEPRMLARLGLAAGAAGVDDRIERTLARSETAALPLQGNSVDRALLVNLYHELPDRRGTLAQASRVLRPGGKLLVIDWFPEGDPLAGPPVAHRISAEQAMRELREEGFRQLERLALYKHHWALRAEK